MCWTLDGQHCLGGRRVDIIGVLIKIWLSVPYVLSTIVVVNPFTILIYITSNNTDHHSS